MAFIQTSCYSEALGHQIAFNAFLPQHHPWERPLTGECKVLYLLHGLGDDHTGWGRQTALERYLEERNIAVIIPNVGRGFYTNTTWFEKNWTFVSEDLPRMCKQFFNISDKRENTFAAGLSMGGYGALKLGLRLPERFGGVISMSGAPMSDLLVNALKNEPSSPMTYEEVCRIFGENIKPEDDIFALTALGAPSPVKSKIMLFCGTADFLYEANRMLKHRLEAGGYDVTWREHPKEAHTWEYWDKCIPEMLDWIERNAG